MTETECVPVRWSSCRWRRPVPNHVLQSSLGPGATHNARMMAFKDSALAPSGEHVRVSLYLYTLLDGSDTREIRAFVGLDLHL